MTPKLSTLKKTKWLLDLDSQSPAKSPSKIPSKVTLPTFRYDLCYQESATSVQEQILHDIGGPLLNHAFKGFNYCVFAYGQTGSGQELHYDGLSQRTWSYPPYRPNLV